MAGLLFGKGNPRSVGVQEPTARPPGSGGSNLTPWNTPRIIGDQTSLKNGPDAYATTPVQAVADLPTNATTADSAIGQITSFVSSSILPIVAVGGILLFWYLRKKG